MDSDGGNFGWSRENQVGNHEATNISSLKDQIDSAAENVGEEILGSNVGVMVSSIAFMEENLEMNVGGSCPVKEAFPQGINSMKEPAGGSHNVHVVRSRGGMKHKERDSVDVVGLGGSTTRVTDKGQVDLGEKNPPKCTGPKKKEGNIGPSVTS